MSSSNYIRNIAIVGAGGRQGTYITKELVRLGKHNLTALTRPDSTNTILDGVAKVNIDYDDHASLVAALAGQEVLIVSLAVTAPRGTQNKLIDAAAEAGVKYIFPNEFNYDFVDEAGYQFARETIVGTPVVEARKKIEATGKLNWVGLSCGFWYTYSLAAGTRCFGFDAQNRVYEKIDNGDVKLTSSTFEQVARAAGALLSLKVEPQGGDDDGPFLSDWKNKACRIQSFHVSQNDIFESLKRVTGTSNEDWNIKQFDSKERWEAGLKSFQAGDHVGLAHALYTRCFFPDGMSTLTGLSNGILGLPEEEIDEFTREALEMK